MIWSFTFNSLVHAGAALQIQRRARLEGSAQLTIAGIEIPIGLLSVFLVLLATALVNLATKSVATVAGVSFSVVFFVIFTVSEHTQPQEIRASPSSR